MSESDVALSLANVSLVRGERQILADIDWTVRRGEHWALIGANGSGKTTLLKVAAGYLWPSRGEVTVLGNRFGRCDVREVRKRIGWVSSVLHDWVPPHETALEIAVSGRFASLGLIQGMTEPDAEDLARARGRLAEMGVEETAEREFRLLSQGEQQKVLLARALVAEPELIVLDEACAGLDLAAREDLLRRIDAMGRAAGGPTFIFVTHHVEEIVPLFGRVLVLRNGRATGQGPAGEVLRSGVLREAFGIDAEVVRAGGRFWCRVTWTGGGEAD